MVLLGLAEDIHYCIRGLEKPGRCCEDGCSAALVSDCPEFQEKTHRTQPHRYHIPVSHCGTFLQVDNAGHSFVAHDTGLIGHTGPAGSSDLYQMVQILNAVSLDSEDHCEGAVLVPLVAAARAPTFRPCFDRCLRTACCRHCMSSLDLANPHYIRKIHPMTHRYFDNAAEAHVEGCH